MKKKKKAVAENTFAIGKFDSLHLGHRALVQNAALWGKPSLLTFPGMAEVLGWGERLPLVAPNDRVRILDEWSDMIGREITITEVPFTEVRELKPLEFIKLLKDKLGAAAVVVGDDFRFGHDRSGDADELARLGKKHGIQVKIIAPVRYDDVVISSSRVRNALEEGRVHEVSGCLGRPYRVVAKVVRGDGRGNKIGFPTANCGALENQPPAAAVYAGGAWIDGEGPWPAAINAGDRPTVDNSGSYALEAHLVGYDGDCYGKRIELELFARLRGERKFPDLDALKAQIRTDIQLTKDLATTYRQPTGRWLNK
jgi:riboflavin kinase/FMN adenylyltransferase